MGLGLFQRSPGKSLVANIKQQRDLRNELAKRLSDAEAKVAESIAVAQKLALDGASDEALDGADHEVVRAEKRVTTLVGALSEADQRLAELERNRDEMEDQKKRRETIADIQRTVEDLEEAGRTFDEAVGRLGEVAKRAGLVVQDGTGLQIFAEQLAEAAPAAINLIVSLMRSHAAAVLSGNAPPSLRQPEAPPAPKPVVSTPTTRVFVVAAFKWRDAAGVQHQQATGLDAPLPVDIADCAIARHLAFPSGSAMANSKRGRIAIGINMDSLIDLDAPETAPGSADKREPALHSAFEQLDRGGPYIASINAGRAS